MPPSDHQPDRYSIDEMMERLKHQPSQSGGHPERELVTRDDGSQVVRVRKRKRRSQQPHRDAIRRRRRARMIQVTTAVLVLLALMIGGGGALLYSNSKAYLDRLNSIITRTTGAKAEITQFRVNPVAASAQSLKLEWPEGSRLRQMNIRGIQADVSIGTLLSKSLIGEELKAQDGVLNLREPVAGTTARFESDSLVPGVIAFERNTINKLRIVYGEPSAPSLWLDGTEVSLLPRTDARPLQIMLNRGSFGMPGKSIPKLRLNRAHMEWTNDRLRIISMRLLHETDNVGELKLSDADGPAGQDEEGWHRLNVETQSFLMSGLGGPELGQLFPNRINTVGLEKPSTLSFKHSETIQGAFTIHFNQPAGGTFEVVGLPFLGTISSILQDEWYQVPAFLEEVGGTLECTAAGVSLRDLDLKERSRMAIRGQLEFQRNQRRLSGELEVGLPESVLATANSPHFESLFGPSEDGFRWVSLKLGGTMSAPTDHFWELYQNAKIAPKPDNNSGPSFEELTKPE
jgi:hypothetical protein